MRCDVLPVLAPRELDLVSGLPDGPAGAEPGPWRPNRPGYTRIIKRGTQGCVVGRYPTDIWDIYANGCLPSLCQVLK